MCSKPRLSRPNKKTLNNVNYDERMTLVEFLANVIFRRPDLQMTYTYKYFKNHIHLLVSCHEKMMVEFLYYYYY